MRGEVEDVAELMQSIQSRLPVLEAARTSVLSKAWLHSWSTIPTLRFRVRKGKNSMELVDVDRTLTRYIRDNIPIQSFDLDIGIENRESASLAEKWIGPVSTKTCLKEFSLHILLSGASFILPDELLLGENLTKIRVSASKGTHSVYMRHPPVINCVSLRELHLSCVHISEEALHHILSSCTLLEKIELLNSCKGFKTVKVKNLPHLYELSVSVNAGQSTTALEVTDVPNLGVFRYDLNHLKGKPDPLPFNAHSISLGSNVTQLVLGGLVPDNACLDMIKSGFPFLENLTLHPTTWKSGSFHFTCASIKRLILFSCPRSLIDIQIHAPKLNFFWFDGVVLPKLLFPMSSLKRIKVSLSLRLPVDASFFVTMREALTLSRKCDLHITTNNYSNLPLDIDIDHLRARLLFPPATNVQELWFETNGDKCVWEQSPFFAAFFEICHPKFVYATPDVEFTNKNHFCRMMLREVLEKKKTASTRTANWPHRLKHVQIRRPRHKKWKTLTHSHTSFLDGSAPGVPMHFKLKWR